MINPRLDLKVVPIPFHNLGTVNGNFSVLSSGQLLVADLLMHYFNISAGKGLNYRFLSAIFQQNDAFAIFMMQPSPLEKY